ncbi:MULTISPECIES: Ig-like domain-containing protein [unclassified Acinetobacter]|uniref:Ig-like domain-containing protein n=1 Tax=unclassified Acinetobacter TaxID=196816 RepID=UPI0015D1F0A5
MKAADGETSDLVFDGTVCAFEQLVWQDGIASFKELTGLEELLPIITGTSTGGVGPLPWIVGGLVTGGIIAATNDDKSHSEPENEPKVEILDAPKVEIANDQNNDGLLNRSETGGASQLNIIVTIPTGAVTGDIITLKDQSGKAYTHTLTQADIDAGKITVQVDKPAEGTELKVTATITNEGGTSAESVPDQAVIHETAPSVQVEIEADYATGKGKVTFTFSEDIDDFDINDIVINGGKIYPDSLVKNPDGTYSATLSDLKKGTAVEVSVKDGSYTDQAGNAGIEGSDEDVSVKVTAIKPDTVGGGSIVTGVTKPNTEVTLKDPATGKTYTTTSNPDGTWSMTTTDPLQDGSSITVTVPNPDSSNPDQSASDEVPLPFVSIDIVGGDNFINEEELAELTDPATRTVKITGTVSNPTADMTITFNGKKYSGIDVKVNADGTWEINVPVEDINLNGKNTIIAKGQVTDSTGTVFPSNDAENQVGTDTTPPNVNVSISPEGKITIAYDPDVDPSSIETGKITVIDQDGNPVTVTLTPSEDGLTFTGQVPDGFDGKITVTVPDGSYQDLNGNQGNPDQESKAVDTQPPQVIVNIDPNGNITVTFDPDVDPSTIDPNTDFVITDKDGNPLKDKDENPVTVPPLTSTDGGVTWTGKIPEGVEGSVSVTVPEGSYQDKTGNEGGKGTDTENVDTLAPKLTVTIDADGTVHFDFSEVVKGFTSEDILVAGSKLVPGSLTDLGNGKWTAKLDSMPKDGTTVEVTVKDDTYTDLTNNLGSGHQDQVITIKIDSVKPNTDGNAIISGKTEPNQTVTVTVPGSDKPLITTSDVNGNWTVTTDFPLKDGNFVTATTPNQDHVIIEDKVKLPFITIDVIAGDDVIDPSERTDIDTQTTMKVTGTISNPNANVTVTFNGVEYSSNSTDPVKKVTVNSDGTWSIQVPADQVGSQNSIEAKASVVDNGTTIDSAPAVRDPITQGSITVDVDSKGHITGTTLEVVPGQTVELIVIGKDKNGVEIEKKIQATVDSNGHYTAKVPTDFEDGNITVIATTKDANNHPLDAKDAEPALDRTSGSITVDITPDGKITGSTTDVPPGATVELVVEGKDPNGNPVSETITVTVDSNGHFTSTVPPSIADGGVDVTGTTTDRNGNPLTDTDNEPALDRTPGQITVDVTPDGQITGSTTDVPPGATVELVVEGKDANGNPVSETMTVTVDSNGHFTSTVSPSIADGGVDVTGTTTDRNGNPLTDTDNEPALDRTPGQITVDVTPDGQITGSTTDVPPGATVELVVEGKDPNGNPVSETITVTVDSNGHFTSTVPPSIADGGVDVTGTTTDRNGNPLTDTDNEPALDRTPGQITVDVTPDGQITGSTTDVPPGATVELVVEGKDPNGNPVSETMTVTVDSNGHFTSTVPPSIADGGVDVTGTTTDRNGNPLTDTDNEPALDRTPGQITVDVTPDGQITGSTTDVPPGATVELVVEGKDPNGNPVSETMTVTVDSNGHFTSTVPPSIADGGVDVTGTTTDRNGNPLTDTDNEPGLDRTPPAVTVEITPDGNIKVTFDPDIDPSTIDPNTDIVITDKDGNPLKDKDGNPVTVPPLTSTDGGITWTGKVPPNVDTEVKVEVPAKDKDGHPTYVDKIGNPGTGGQATVIVDTLPPTVKVAISEDRTSVNFIFDELIQGFDASDIVVTGGQLKPGTLIENADGTWTAQLQNTEQGTTVEVMVKDQSYTDLVGNVGLGATDTDITIKITSVTSIVGSNDKLITGLTGANQDVTVILPNGTVVEGIRSDEHGYWELTTEILEGTNDQITAQTKNQDEKPIADTISLPFVSIDLVSGNDVINEAEYADFANTVTITGKVSNPDVSMTVTIAGKIYTGSQVTVNADGTWSVNVPKADVAQDFDITAQATSNTSGATSDDASRDVTVDIEPPKVTVDIDTTGKITLKYAPDVDPTSIDLSQVTVKDTLGNVIPVKWNISDSSALNFDAMIEMPVDDIITVTVPKGSYQDLVGNLGLAGSDAEDIDNAAPDIQSFVIKTDEDTSVVITWAHLGIRDNSTDLSKLTISFTQLPANGTLYLNGQAVTDVNVLTGLTKADLDAGQLSFQPDLNEASTTADSAYTTLDFEVHDGINTSTGSVDVMVEAVADTPNLSLDLLDWSPTALNLNIKTWEGLKSVTIDGKTYNLLQGNGSGMPADTLKTVFNYLTSDKNTTHKPATSGETSSLADSNVATYKGVAITGYVYLEKGHTYNYKGKADDSGMLIIGNEDPVYVSWGGLNQSVDYSFVAAESGFYTFDFYMHNQAGQGNYDFQLIDQSHGDKISYYPDLETALSSLNDFYHQANPSVEWKVSDLIQGSATDKDENGFHRPYFNLSGEVGQDISLGLLNTSLNDIDGSESLTLNFSGLVEGMMIYALAADGSRLLLGTANAQGQLSLVADGVSLDGASLVAVAPADFVVTGSSLGLKVKVEAIATEQSNHSAASSELEFDMTLYPSSNAAFKAMAFVEHTAVEQDADLIFNVLNDDDLGGNRLTPVNDFASTDQIDVSALLDHNASLENINEYLKVSYDAEQDQAVISIDRDGTGTNYQSADLLILSNQTTDLTLEQLLQNNQIII